MWSRAQLKEKAKMSLKANYWKVVLVTLIVFVIGGASTGIELDLSGNSESDPGILDSYLEDADWIDELNDFLTITDSNDPAFEFDDVFLVTGDENYSDQYGSIDNSDEYTEGYYDGYKGEPKETDVAGDYSDGYNDGALDAYYESVHMEGGEVSVEGDWTDILENTFDESVLSRIGVIAGVVVVIGLVAVVIGTVISVFVFSPLEVGTKRFFVKNLNEAAELKEVIFAFDHSYMNVVKILFIRSLCIFGWSLLFVIPGIVKAYEYMMIPYLLAENPELSKEQAFALSKQMMTGNKWNTFVLELSFIGWDILCTFTLGILNIFYVQPYKCLTYAALYEELSLINGRPAFAGQPNMEQYYYQTNPYAQTDTNTYGQNTYESQTDTSGYSYNMPNEEGM